MQSKFIYIVKRTKPCTSAHSINTRLLISTLHSNEQCNRNTVHGMLCVLM